MNDGNYTINSDKIDSIEFTANGGLALIYKNHLYVIFEISKSEAKNFEKLSQSETLVEAVNKMIAPQKNKSKELALLRQALDINATSSNVIVLENRKNKIGVIIRSQGERAYICNYYTCTLITTRNGDIQDLLIQP